MNKRAKSILTYIFVIVVIAAAIAAWWKLRPAGLPAGIVAGNGRIEATEIDIAAKAPGRITEILAREGDFVQANTIVARMDTLVLRAQQAEAKAQVRRAEYAYQTAKSIVVQRNSEQAAARAVVAQRQAELDAARKRLKRTQTLWLAKALQLSRSWMMTVHGY